MNDFFFSVIVPTHNRSSLLESLFKSLTLSKAAFRGQIETIIIDSSSKSEAKIIQSLCERYSARYYYSINQVTKKRNIGIMEAIGNFIFLTDSDCELTEEVFNEHMRTYENFGKDKVGVLGLTLVTGDTAPIWSTLRLDTSFTTAFSFARWMDTAPWGTCTNISFPREAITAIGGFDENWGLPVYGEDVDLGLRFNKAGYEIRSNPQAIVKHNSSSINGTWQVVRKKFMSGKADYYLGSKHPEKLALEYPGWVTMSWILFPVAIAKSIINGKPTLLLIAVGALVIGIFFQALLTLLAMRSGLKSLFRHTLVIIFEAVFEAGKHFQSLLKGKINRLWTKFVYSEKQLLGERDKRIRQVWSCVLAFSLFILLSGILE